MMIPLQIPRDDGFPWFPSGANWILQPSTWLALQAAEIEALVSEAGGRFWGGGQALGFFFGFDR